MLRISHRLAPTALAATALLVLACSEQTTAPSDVIAGPRLSVVPAAYIIDTGPGGTSSIGSRTFFTK